jgi:hypothetical protein
MNGLDAARVLKRIMPNRPVVTFSEYSNAFSEQEARSAGSSSLQPRRRFRSGIGWNGKCINNENGLFCFTSLLLLFDSCQFLSTAFTRRMANELLSLQSTVGHVANG